jgi:hypothetical protein
MRKFVFAVLSALILCNAAVLSVYANSVTVDTSINRDVHVVFTFSNITLTTYIGINSSRVFNETTIPNMLMSTMLRNGHVGVNYSAQSISFNNTALTVVAAFNLAGPNIINSTLDRGAKVEIFHVNTVWREFYLNMTKDFHFNFTQVLAKPFSEWTSKSSGGITSYSYSQTTSEAGFSASFHLPLNASSVVVFKDSIIFDLPYEPSFEDNFVNSPIIILVALAVVGVIVLIYRKVR